MATTLLEGLVSSALAGNELFESLFRAAGPCLLVEAWRDAGAPRAFDGTALPGWSPKATLVEAAPIGFDFCWWQENLPFLLARTYKRLILVA